MIHSTSHRINPLSMGFPAVVVSSKPLDPDVHDTDDIKHFPRIYEWKASEGSQVMASWWKIAKTYTLPSGPWVCVNEADPLLGWATNVSERFYDSSLHNNPVPVGTPITICNGRMPMPEVNPPECTPPMPETVINCAPSTGIWFSCWVDPRSIMCRG